MAFEYLPPVNTLTQVALVRPMYARNVGLCARAMQNLGFSKLTLVDPKFSYGKDLQQGAARADQIWKSAETFDSWSTFLNNSSNSVIVALSGKPSTKRKQNLLDKVLEEIEPGRNISFVFGPEDDGLLSEELDDCNKIAYLPVSRENPSYNLSHAVLLTLYTFNFLRSRSSNATADLNLNKKVPLRPDSEMQTPNLSIENFEQSKKLIDNWLETLGFDLSRPQNAARIIKRVLLENCPDVDEIRVLNSVLSQTIRGIDRK